MALEPRGRSKALGIALWAAILSLVAAVVAGVVFVQRYQPLLEGSIAGISRETKSVETYGDASAEIITPWKEGSTFYAGFTIRNDGPIGVTIERILAPYELRDRAPSQGFDPIAAKVAPPERFAGAESIGYTEYDNFAPFELAPGEERRVAIQYQLNECVTGGFSWVDSISTRFSLWGMTRDVDFPLPYRLVADSQYQQGC